MKKKTIILLSIFLSCCTHVAAQEASFRERILLNADWHFKEGDPNKAAEALLEYTQLKPFLLPCSNDFIQTVHPHIRPIGNPGEEVAYTKPDYDDNHWRTLDLPHDWAIEKPFNIDHDGSTGKLPYWGIAWYRNSFYLEKEDANKQIYIDIDGAMSYASLWCNGKYVGGWPYGYASFRLDLTPYVKPGQKNQLSIRLNNPNNSSRWYPGAGIYRNVWLVKTAPIHVAQWGTFVRNVNLSEAKAVMEIGVTVENHTKQTAEIEVVTDFFLQDANGQPVGSKIASTPRKRLSMAGKAEWKEQFIIPSPNFWEPDSPTCYVAVTSLRQDGKEIENYHTPFGIRDSKFTPDEGFLLNGRKVFLKGVCMHHDLGALGSAFNLSAAERQLHILKEMGINAIRTSHNPPAPELVALCDRMGIMMQLELADAWLRRKRKNDYSLLFPDWSEADMRSLVRHYRNHPSVIMWSIGNEMPDMLADTAGETARALTGYAHSEDPTRPTTFGCNNRKAILKDIAKEVDVFGVNYDRRSFPLFKQTHPNKPTHASETSSATSSRGEYFFPVTNNQNDSRSDFQLSSYDMTTVNWGCNPSEQFKTNEANYFLAGEFVWTGFDYLGEPTPYNKDITNLLNFNSPEEKEKARKELEALGRLKNPSRSSYFGIVDLCGFPKDRYYQYKSYWRPDVPTVHILPHWNWEERIGEVTPIHLYTSGDAAELFLNGKSLGVKKKQHAYERLTWDDVIYQPGTVKAVAYKQNKKWAEETVKTTGKATKLKMIPEKTSIQNDGVDLVFVRVDIVDEDGQTVPRSKNLLKFSVEGPAEIVATDNGDATSLVSFLSHEREAYNGLALVIIRAQKGKAGVAKLTVQSDKLTPAHCALQINKK